jgi:hypothetical protein
MQIERRRKFDRRSGGHSRPSIVGTVETAREHIANAIQMFKQMEIGEPQADLVGVADAVISRLTRALAELEAGRV